jgi:hypothetical protein
MFVEHRIASLGAERVAGAALEGGTLFTWGDRLLAWDLPGTRPRVLAAKGGFGEAGCLMDVDGDGAPDLVVAEDGRLVWRQSPGWKRREIDREIDTPDLLPAAFHGRRGVLLIQKYTQVRFYEVPGDLSAGWPPRDVYSFYTPSHEAGLLLHDVDGDGVMDILSGNYWIKTPERFDLSWRLYAINTWNERPWSAAARLALAGEDLVVSEGEVEEHARLARFEKPADPRQLWRERRLDGELNLHKPHGLVAGDFGIAVGEDHGPESRLLLFREGGVERIGGGAPIRHLFAWNGGLLAAGPDTISWWAAPARL